MKISVNLATRPFVELRPLFAKLRLTMILLAVLAVGFSFWLHALRGTAAIATAEMNSLKAQTDAVRRERASNEARMMQPQNKGVLDRSVFLNEVFARKSFSWTAVMMDLERVLPNGVQVTSIEPGISKEGEVSIKLRVTGDRDKAIQLVRNLERSQRFAGPRLGGETALNADKAKAFGAGGGGQFRNVSGGTGDQPVGNGVEFEIFSDYNPLPENAGKKDEGRGKSLPAADISAVHHRRKPSVLPLVGRPVQPLPPARGGVR